MQDSLNTVRFQLIERKTHNFLSAELVCHWKNVWMLEARHVTDVQPQKSRKKPLIDAYTF